MILLTSPSPRRKELLQQIGFNPGRDFVQIDMPINIDFHVEKETLELDEAVAMLEELTWRKVKRAVEERRALVEHRLIPERTAVVGATTVTYFDKVVRGRPLLPHSEEMGRNNPDLLQTAELEAERMLSALSGKEFLVLTSVVIARGDDLDKRLIQTVSTRVRLKPYTAGDIKRYIQTHEPLDKAGGFGIQERGVALFDAIEGSYSNVVGLPIYEFYRLLSHPYFVDCFEVRVADPPVVSTEPRTEGRLDLKLVSIGDINYDLRCSQLPDGFFQNLRSPGAHVEHSLERKVGGTGVNFAAFARAAGFKRCAVLGVIAGDELGKYIEKELHEHGIETLLPVQYGKRTSIALMLRDRAYYDTLITLTDADQQLTEADVLKARPDIEAADVLYVSGYCLTDSDRRQATLKAMEWARAAQVLVVLDVTVNMHHAISFEQFLRMTQGKVNVLVSEIPTILAWLNSANHDQYDLSYVRRLATDRLVNAGYPVLFLRTDDYSSELVLSPGGPQEAAELDYPQLAHEVRSGYGDRLTIDHLYQYLSPRILLASQSPRRLALLQQVVAANKVQVAVSGLDEEYQEGELPADRVKRLASGKALRTWQEFQAQRSPREQGFIQVVIGADTEIVLDGRIVGRPSNPEQARQILQSLSGKAHQAITGYALLDTRAARPPVEGCVITEVKFKDLSADEIEQYVQSGEPLGKAGAYGIQGKAALFIEHIRGSYSNVVGLPLERLSDELNRMGLPIWEFDKVTNWAVPRARDDEDRA
jgi:septum formation protein